MNDNKNKFYLTANIKLEKETAILKEKTLEPKTVKKSDVSPNQKKKNKLVKQAASLSRDDVRNMTAVEYSNFLDGAHL